MARAMRADKTCLAGVAATLNHYLRNEAERYIPVWQMISMPIEAAQKRASQWAEAVGSGQVQASQSTLGGGSLPGEMLPSQVLAIRVDSPDRLLKSLRSQDPPIVGRAEKGKVLLDPRTVAVEQDAILVRNLRAALSESG